MPVSVHSGVTFLHIQLCACPIIFRNLEIFSLPVGWGWGLVCTYACVRVYVCTPSVCSVVGRSEECVRAPGMVLEAAVSHYVGTGTKLQSSARAVSALNH